MGMRILVIEDEDEIADFLVRGLREEGFGVERAADGEDGSHHLKTGTCQEGQGSCSRLRLPAAEPSQGQLASTAATR
jgi:CheY-like chemotaxis protein